MTCQPPRAPFTGSGRVNEGGSLAVHKQDFNAHASGEAFRHCADQIDMSPELSRIPGEDVQTVLENIDLIIGTTKMFVSIGSADGYATGNYNVGDPGINTLEDAFAAAFSDTHLTNGGYVVLLAGTYEATTTINVPAGITIWGEPRGAIINAKMTEEPLFKILTSEGSMTIGSTTTLQDPLGTKLQNLTLIDNLNKEAGYTLKTAPLISCALGSNFMMEQVTCIGHIDNDGYVFSARAVDHDLSVSAGGKATTLEIKNCYFDGFSTAIRFGGSGGGRRDSFSVTDCKIRYFGNNVSGISEPDLSQNKSAISTTNCAINIVNNYFYGENDGVNYFASTPIYIIDRSVSTGSGNVIISGNSGILYGVGGTPTEKRLFIDNNYDGTILALSDKDNHWEYNYGSKWKITVGDGVKSFGDISGELALDTVFIAMSYSPTDDIVVEVLPGNYLLTENSNTFNGNLVGITYPGDTDRAVIEIYFTNNILDNFSYRTTYINSVKNIEFESRINSGTGLYPLRSITITGGGANNNQYVESCKFNNIALNLQPAAGQTSIIKNCNFSENSPSVNYYPIFVSRQVGQGIMIEDCLFTASYSLCCGQSTTYSESSNFSLNINRCVFDTKGQTISSVVANPSDITPYLSSYIFADLYTNGSINLENSTFVLGYSVNGYQTLNQTIIDSSGVNELIYLQAKNVKVHDCIGYGCNQAETGSGTETTAFFHINAVSKVDINNCDFIASQPLAITGTNITAFPATTGQPLVNIKNSKFRQYEIDVDFFSISVVSIYLPSTSGLTFNSLIFENNLIQANSTYTGTDIDKIRQDYTNTDATQGGIANLGISAMGWNVVVDNNVITGKLPDLSTYRSNGLFLANSGGPPTSSKITNNSIYSNINMSTAGSNHESCCIHLYTGSAIISNNTFSFENNGTIYTEDSFIGWLAVVSSTMIDVSNNKFERVGNLQYYGLSLDASYLIFKNNEIGTYAGPTKYLSTSAQRTTRLFKEIDTYGDIEYSLIGSETNVPAAESVYNYTKTQIVNLV